MSAPRPAFHRREGGGYAPTGLGLSPWDGRSQSGVSLAGLVAHVLEGVPSRVPMLTARITLDILGSVPMDVLRPAVRVLRDGPRMQLVEAELTAGGRSWVRATALRARLDESPTVAQPLAHPFPADAPVRHATPWFDMVRVHGDLSGFDTQATAGSGAMWVHITADAVEGEPLTPLQRLAIVADFSAGAAPLVPFRQWTSANLDIAMYMTRLPAGAWLLVDAASESAGNGIGVARARIGDRDGMFATTLQTTFLGRREPSPGRNP